MGPGQPRLIELGASWREELLVELMVRVPPGLWDAAYDADARYMADQALSRALDVMTGYGSESLAESRVDVVVSVERVDPDRTIGRGDFRYKSDNLATWLRANPGRDLVPIVCGRSSTGWRVMDGHHRLRAYQAVGRSPLAVVVTARRGTGRLTVR